METPSAYLRDLARRLLALEAASCGASERPEQAVERLCETLRTSLTRLAGGDGFAALLRRALALAEAELPALASVKLKEDGGWKGLEAAGAEGAVALTAHVLNLLVTFIGQPLTLRLVREAWPEAAVDE